MRRSCFFIFITFVLNICVFGQIKPLYQLPDVIPSKQIKESDEPFLVGTDNGLYRILSNGIAEPLWNEGKISFIHKTQNKWWFICEKGILSSEDLKHFSLQNNGLPSLMIKTYDGKNKHLLNKAALLKDLSSDPFDPNILVTATKDNVYLTRNGGTSWEKIGSMSRGTSGIKAVAVSHMDIYAKDGTVSGSELVVFMIHPIYGFSYYRADAPRPAWTDVSAGFCAIQGFTQPDEIADILPVMCRDSNGKMYTDLYMTNTYIPNIYRFNWKTKRAEKVYEGKDKLQTMDGLCQSNDKIIFVEPGKVSSFSLVSKTISDLQEFNNWRLYLNVPRSLVSSAYVPKSISGCETSLQLNELWLLTPDFSLTAWGEKADSRKAVYASVYQLRLQEGIDKYKRIVRDNKLNALVIDMKDDYGLLRFDPNSEMLKKMGKVTQYKIDVNHCVSEFKKEGIYLIARIVVFKDKALSNYDKKQYAVWDSSKNAPWVGIRGYEDVTDEDGNSTGKNTIYYDENWVDPYSEKVWEYNVEIARELVARGFDEIQFDYIRFPTDGINLGKASFRWRDSGMDKESALISFLSYARKNINAPIGIDIYGANGWYRSGTRTGQDVEMMSEYVDVICPMYYPSHFEQDFLEFDPKQERPYRIYFYGSYRNTVMGRNKIVVRPWVQAFKMGVRYDRQWYNKDYVLRQVFGVRDGLNRGYMYWNNSGGYYEDISPDPQDEEISPWHKDECDLQKRLPAFSSDHKDLKNLSELQKALEEERNKKMISILDTVLNPEDENEAGTITIPLLRINAFGGE